MQDFGVKYCRIVNSKGFKYKGGVLLRKSWIFTISILMLALSGCAKISLEEVSKQYYQGNPQKAYELTQKGANLPKVKEDGSKEEAKWASGDELLWQIQGGIIAFDLKKPEAKEMLELAEKNINHNELQGFLSSMFENFGAILVNDTVMDYKGFLYEGAMVNYYKALLYMGEKNYADARVEFNRASDRQRRIKEYYEKEIAKAQEEEQNAYTNKKNEGDPKKQKEEGNKILQSYSNLSKFSSLNGYINPMIDYISGVFFMLEGDKGKAIDFLKESYGVSGASVIKEDLQMAQEGKNQEKYTWVIIEDGKSPFKIEKRFSIPLYTGSSWINIAIALPDMKEGVEFASDYTIAGSQNIQAQKISTLNPLVFNEFGKQIPFIITRGVISSTTKALIQHGTQKATKGTGWLNVFTTIGGMVYSAATTKADTRISTLMPNGFYVARVSNAEGKINVYADKRVIATFDFTQDCQNKDQLCVSKDYIIYIRNAQKNIFNQVLYSK